MSNSQTHCLRSYHEYGPVKIETFAHGVSTGIFDNSTTFTSPPVTKTVYDGLVDTYHSAYEAFKNGGKSQKGAYLTALENMMEKIDALADYVDGLPDLDEALITLAGFVPTKVGDSKAVVPEAPAVEKIIRSGKGTLVPVAKAVKGATYYGCLLLNQPISEAIVFIDGQLTFNNYNGSFRLLVTKGRKKTITMLKSGDEYWVYFYAGNSAGVSGFGEGESIVCG